MPKELELGEKTKPETPDEDAIKAGAEAYNTLFSEENDEPPYYSNTKQTKDIKRIADLLSDLDEFRAVFQVDVRPKDVAGSVEAALLERKQIEEKIAQHAGNPLLVDVVIMLLTGDTERLNRLAKAFEAAQPAAFERRSKARSAAIWTIVACDSLYSEGRRAGSVKQQDVLRLALQLQAEYEDRLYSTGASKKVGKKSIGFMPDSDPWLGSRRARTLNWRRIFSDLGINLGRAKRGRKTNKEREERAKKFSKAKIQIHTPSK
jgi:hypothetical protein